MEKLYGILSATSATLHGTLSARSVIGVEIYDGEYTVHSEAHEVQTLPTANKQLVKNIIVEKIPYFETSNLSDGITAYIGSEVEIYGE
ncbi:hypothetical protein [Phascolarctobacterium succinatutens]|uniref:hypothetical protein n=1 Tax=Phascolarctobacterium succinatutens TaxID=626940 RepID=UPI0026F29E3D|nr:hypothetical protein [Phascolarctobacterium succinatutens]